MPKATTKTRQELRSRFVRNAIPTEADFADLIAASLNLADDGLLKLPDQPLGLVRQKADQPVLRLFADSALEGAAWQMQLIGTDKPGLALANQVGTTALFLDGATGNVGLGTATPGQRLTVEGNWTNALASGIDLKHAGILAIRSNAPQLDFIDTDANSQDWAIHVNVGKMFFIRSPWEVSDLVLDGTGNVGLGTASPQGKLTISEATGTAASATTGSLLIDHENSGGASSIVFRSKVDRGSDYAFMEYRDKNANVNDVQAGLLTIGIQNEANDHLALMPSGNVGIGTTVPGYKLHVKGTAGIGGQVEVLTDSNPIRLSSEWSNYTPYGSGPNNQAEISNDINNYKCLMIYGNKSAGGGRRVAIGDVLTVMGDYNLGKDSDSALNNGGQLTIKSTSPQIDFIDTNAGDWAINVNDNKMSFFYEPWNVAMTLDSTGKAGIGTTTPTHKLTVEGTWTNALASGIDLKYAGILAIRSNAPQLDFIDTDANSKDWAIHVNSGKMFFIRSPWEDSDLVLDGTGNVGIGTTTPDYKLHVKGTAGIGGQVEVLTDSNPIRFSSGWTGFASIKYGVNVNNAEISNDTNNYKCLMIAGNKSANEAGDGRRKVAIFDDLTVYGTIYSKQNVKKSIEMSDEKRTSGTSWANGVVLMETTFTLQTKAWVLVLFKGGGVHKTGIGYGAICFSLSVGEGKGDYTVHEFTSDKKSARDVTLMYFGELEAGSYTCKAQMIVSHESATGTEAIMCTGQSTRKLTVVQLS